MVHAGISELRRGFAAHRKAAGPPSASQYLLLFYAAECGLKLVWLRQRNLRNTQSIDPALLSRGHDLMMWAKELRLSPQVLQVTGTFHLQRDGQQLPIALAHQAWRYGISIDTGDEGTLVTWLSGLCEWASEEAAR